jgi:hypothetical protein
VAAQSDGSAIDTPAEGRGDTATSTARTLQDLDRICLEAWTYTSSASSKAAILGFDGTTDPVDQTATADAASYISFEGAITEYSPSGRRFLLR